MARIVDQKRCAQEVYAGSLLYWPQCSRRGVFLEHGKLWCKQHAPSQVEARHKRCMAEIHDAMSAKAARREREAARNSFIAKSLKAINATEDDLIKGKLVLRWK